VLSPFQSSDWIILQAKAQILNALFGAEGYPGGLIETMNGGAGTCSLRCFQILIESVYLGALKIPAPKGGILTNG
jgi:hypothetical protein